ncbi:MAG: hypothetical protein KAT58_01645 [candidate division Zixibacteria bacterium]|nr:hypothetical protein [candidate division Zixibacteria bacterium]
MKQYSRPAMNSLLAVVLVSLTLGVSMCGNSEKTRNTDLALLLEQAPAGWRFTGQVERYDRETIFEYIDGAGEVYRQYSFRECIVRRLSCRGEPDITVEIFDMGSSADAYGIFSHIREAPEAGFGQGSQYAGSVLYFWQSRYLVSIYPKEQTDETRTATAQLANSISAAISDTGAPPQLLKALPTDSLMIESIRYFHHHVLLNYHYYFAAENILNLNEQTKAVLATYEPVETYLLLVRYPSSELAKTAAASFVKAYLPEADEPGPVQTENQKWTAIETINNTLIVVFDAPTGDEATTLITLVKARLAQSATQKGQK